MITASQKRDLMVMDLDEMPSSKPGQTEAEIIFVSEPFRVDNRAELAEQLNLSDGVSDHDLLLKGWTAWGTDLADRLRGAFAFALLLPESGQVYCARDVFGLAPFYYAIEGRKLFLGRSSRLVRSVLPRPATLNTLMMADFVGADFQEKEQTFFEEILRLRPGHTLIVKEGKLAIRPYWSMSEVDRDHSPPDAPKIFRALFDRSVQNCINDADPIVLISGGMDSSSIAASMHASQPGRSWKGAAKTFPRLGDNWLDKPFLDEACRSLSIDLYDLPSDDFNPLQGMAHWVEVMDGPYLAYGHANAFHLVDQIRQAGAQVLLSGHGGDEIVSYGFGRFNELAKQGKWLTLWRETKARTPTPQPGDLRFRLRLLRSFSSHLRAVRAWRWIKSKLRGRPAINPGNSDLVASSDWVSPELLEQYGSDRHNPTIPETRRDHDERMLQENVMSMALNPMSLEIHAVCAAAAGVDIRFPFYDRDLLEFSLSLRSDWKLRDGYTRYILRAAMGEDLPRSIRERKDKFDFGDNFVSGLLLERQTLSDLINPEKRELGRFVNLEKLTQLKAKLDRGDDFEGFDDRVEAYFLWRVAILSLWLDIVKRPLTPPPLEPIAGTSA